MNIRERRAIHEKANLALSRANNPQKVILVYAAVCCGLALLAMVLTTLLSNRISGTGGLGNIGLRSVLSTGQSVLPLINMVVTACLSLGYHIAILSITRGFEADSRTLSGGFRYFGPVVRTLLLQGLIYSGIALTATYISSFIFLATPYAAGFMEVMQPHLSSLTVMDSGIMLDEAVMLEAMESIMPMMWILLVVCLLLIVPVYYRFRMVNFALADDPRKGAFHALVKSRRLMRRNCFALFRLDLTLWWFYLGQIAVNLICYGDLLLPALGVTLPWSNKISYYLFYGLSLVAQFALYYFGMNRVYSVYAVAYDVLQEDLPQPNYPVQM